MNKSNQLLGNHLKPNSSLHLFRNPIQLDVKDLKGNLTPNLKPNSLSWNRTASFLCLRIKQDLDQVILPIEYHPIRSLVLQGIQFRTHCVVEGRMAKRIWCLPLRILGLWLGIVFTQIQYRLAVRMIIVSKTTLT